MCEQLEVAPGRLRAALAEFLARADADGLSLAAARACLLDGRTKPTRRRGS
jgi:hypothetical protein